MPLPTRTDRIRGALLGSAIGDALGAPLEGLSSQQIRAHYPDRVTDYVDGQRAWRKKPYRWRLPGLYSDDTQQAIAIADVLLANGRVDLDHLARVFVELATPEGNYAGAHRGVGRSFRQVLGALKAGRSPSETGQPDSAGVGAAMRIAPVALYFGSEDLDALHNAIVDASLITHRDVRSVAGAMAVAHAVRRLLDGEDREPSFLLRLAGDVHKAEKRIEAEHGRLVTAIDEHGSAISRAIAHAEGLLEIESLAHDRERVLAMIVEEANRHGAKPGACKRATMGFPPACIPACLIVLHMAESFEDALIEMVNLGGDADSTGAILGALAGAHFGYDQIPTRWLMKLRNREGLEARAEAICKKSTEGLRIPDLVETERTLSAEENLSRSALIAEVANGGGNLGARFPS